MIDKEVVGATRGERIVFWIMGAAFTIMLMLVGVVYANIQKEIDLKADKDVVMLLLQTTDEMQKDIKTILREMPRKK